MEADLAFRGIDLRDFWRRGSGMTARRLLVLIQCLPPESLTQRLLEAEHEKAQRPSQDRIRERAEFYARGGK